MGKKKQGPPPPEGLSDAARVWWNRLMTEYTDWSADALMTLGAGLQAFDRWKQAEETISRDGPTVLDRFQQEHAHPLLKTEHDSRAAMLKALGALGLEQPQEAKPDASELGRRAALQRWHGGA